MNNVMDVADRTCEIVIGWMKECWLILRMLVFKLADRSNSGLWYTVPGISAPEVKEMEEG